MMMILFYTGCPKKSKNVLVDHKTIGFCLIIKFCFQVDAKHFNLGFETKFAQIGYDLSEMH